MNFELNEKTNSGENGFTFPTLPSEVLDSRQHYSASFITASILQDHFM